MRCVKIIKKLDIISRDLLKYVQTEVRLLRELDHPFVTRSLGKYQDASSIYIVFELYRGGDLHHRLKELKTLPEADCKFYASQVVCGLEYLHKSHVVYRGIKPENLMIDEAGYCRLVDLGLAKQLSVLAPGHPEAAPGSLAARRTYSTVGTPHAFAPEMLTLGSEMNADGFFEIGYGEMVDWWALGIVGVELLAGARASQGHGNFGTGAMCHASHPQVKKAVRLLNEAEREEWALASLHHARGDLATMIGQAPSVRVKHWRRAVANTTSAEATGRVSPTRMRHMHVNRRMSLSVALGEAGDLAGEVEQLQQAAEDLREVRGRPAETAGAESSSSSVVTGSCQWSIGASQVVG